MHYEYVIIGTGPGGAMLARQLARAGRQVLLLERGRDWRRHPLYGTYAGALTYADRRALLFTREGVNIIRPIMVGGATNMFAGCSADPLAWWQTDYGIDLAPYATAIKQELQIQPLDASQRGAASTHLAMAAGQLGMQWLPQDKFMWPARTTRFRCGAHCMLGCRCGAKWTAGEFVDDAVAAGAQLLTQCRADEVLHDGARVRGVRVRERGRARTRTREIAAANVIIAAGGIGTPLLLRDSGLPISDGMAMDLTVMVYGHSREVAGQGHEPPMTWSYADDELGVLYSTLIDPWLMYPIIMAAKGPLYPLTWRRWGNTLGVMIKLKDDLSGSFDAKGPHQQGPDGTRSRAYGARRSRRARHPGARRLSARQRDYHAVARHAPVRDRAHW